MKSQKFERKLSLNKKTIANLYSGELGHVKGGIEPPTTDYTCLIETCPTDCRTCPNPPHACAPN